MKWSSPGGHKGFKLIPGCSWVCGGGVPNVKVPFGVEGGSSFRNEVICYA